MDLKVRVGRNQFMIRKAFLPKGSDWLCWRPAPKPSREQAKLRTTTLGIQGPPKRRREGKADRRGQACWRGLEPVIDRQSTGVQYFSGIPAVPPTPLLLQ